MAGLYRWQRRGDQATRVGWINKAGREVLEQEMRPPCGRSPEDEWFLELQSTFTPKAAQVTLEQQLRPLRRARGGGRGIVLGRRGNHQQRRRSGRAGHLWAIGGVDGLQRRSGSPTQR